MMITPIACGAAISDDFSQVRQNMFELMKSTTVEDAVDLYDAINIADAGGMGDQDEYNVTTETAKDKLRANNQTMFDVLEISAPKDRLGNELTTGMGVVFELGYPTYDNLRKTTTSNKACVLTFLTILSEVPDTLISRKYGDDKASEVSLQAKQLLKFSDEDIFEDKLNEFDDYLYENKLNPGTTDDLVAASIFVRYLKSNF